MEQTVQFPKNLTLEWLKRNELPLYVRNITRPRGMLAVNFMLPSGKTKTVNIPRTHLPFPLSDRMGWDTILQSDDLRACINQGVLDIIRPDVAEKELGSEGAVEEANRLRYSKFSAKNTFVSKRVQDMEETINRAENAKDHQLEPLGIETNVIQPRVLSMAEKLKHGEMSIKAALSELKTMEGELKETDCSYLIASGPEGQVRQHCQKVLASLRNAGASEYDISSDDDSDLTPEEKEAELAREMRARQFQEV